MAEPTEEQIAGKVKPEFPGKVGEQSSTTSNTPTQQILDSLAAQKGAAYIDSYRQNTEERKIYADKIYWFTVGWSCFIALMLLLCAAQKIFLSDTILGILIGSFTAQVFGFLYIVFKYLFNIDPPEKN